MKGAGEAVKPADMILKGPLGDVVIRDNGDGVLSRGDKIDIVFESSRNGDAAEQIDTTGDEVLERLVAMGVRGIPFGTPFKPLAQYVAAMEEARTIARGYGAEVTDAVERKLRAAREAADEAGIAFDGWMADEIRMIGGISPERKRYEELTSVPAFNGLGFIEVEHRLDEAAALAKAAGISVEQVERDALAVRFVQNHGHFISALAWADEGKMERARASLAEAANIADMGDFEDTFDEMLAVEYGRLVSDPLVFDGKSFIGIERTLDLAAMLAAKSGIAREKVERDAQNIRHALCNRHYLDALTYAREGRQDEARASIALAANIADMGDFEDDFERMKAEVDRLIAEAPKKEGGRWGQLLKRIGGALSHPPGTEAKQFSETPYVRRRRGGW